MTNVERRRPAERARVIFAGVAVVALAACAAVGLVGEDAGPTAAIGVTLVIVVAAQHVISERARARDDRRQHAILERLKALETLVSRAEWRASDSTQSLVARLEQVAAESARDRHDPALATALERIEKTIRAQQREPYGSSVSQADVEEDLLRIVEFLRGRER